jgi:hypothetical protein
MRTTSLIMLALAAGISARADFSYTTTRKSAAATPAAGADSKYFMKGQKMMVETGGRTIIMDFDAQTITTIDNSQKTYTVSKFADLAQAMPAGADVQVDAKETGQRKAINGFNASEMLLTMQVEMAQAKGMKMQMEMDLWVSPDVPGAQEMASFYKRNRDRFPWGALSQGGNPSMAQAMATIQRKLAEMNGVPVLQTIRMKPAGGSDAQNAQMQQGMSQARARLEEMQKQGGPQAAAAAQALARMGAAPGSGSGFETTMESSNFSSASIPESVFAIPAGYKRVEK